MPPGHLPRSGFCLLDRARCRNRCCHSCLQPLHAGVTPALSGPERLRCRRSSASYFAYTAAATPVWLHGGEDALARLVTVSASFGCHIGAASISTFSLFAEVAFGSKAESGMCLPSRIATLQDSGGMRYPSARMNAAFEFRGEHWLLGGGRT